MTRTLLIWALLAALLCSFAPSARAISELDLLEPETLNLSLGTGFEFETGDYGTDRTIDIWRVPLLIEWAPVERLALSLEIPYLHQSNTGTTVLLGGMPRRRNRLAGSGGSTTTSSQSGLGDVTLDASLTLLQEGAQTPRLLGLVYAKLPTADEDKGLGTGEFDFGGGLGLGKKFGLWSAYGEAQYILPGTSSTFDPDRYWEWLAALSYRTGSALRPGISLSGGTSPFAGADDPLEVKARLGGLGGEHSSYSIYLSRGLSDASPDWGLGIFGYLDF